MAEAFTPNKDDVKRAWVAHRGASTPECAAEAAEQEFERWYVVSGMVAVAAHLAEQNDTPSFADCWSCAAAASERLKARGDQMGALSFRMYLCPECGSKRCAKANDHRKACDAAVRAVAS